MFPKYTKPIKLAVFLEQKIKIGGGNGGHNGLASIDNCIGTDYKRLRIGIGHPGSKDLVSSYVLQEFNKEDFNKISNIIKFLSKILHASALPKRPNSIIDKFFLYFLHP